MKEYQVRANQIPDLVTLAAALFRKMNEETKSPNHNPSNLRDEATKMHFVADLLKDLVGVTYPVKESNMENAEIDIKNLIKVAEFQSFDEMMEAIAGIARVTKPPKAGEF